MDCIVCGEFTNRNTNTNTNKLISGTKPIHMQSYIIYLKQVININNVKVQ